MFDANHNETTETTGTNPVIGRRFPEGVCEAHRGYRQGTVAARGDGAKVEFYLGAALVAGFAGNVALSLVMAAARAAGVTAMPGMPMLLGSMMAARRKLIRPIGLLLHFVVLGAVVFGLIYAALFTAFDSAAWWVGALIGLVHGVLVGAVVLPVVAAVHPRMRRQPAMAHAGAREAVVQRPDGTVEVAAPGFMGRCYGAMTPIGIVIAHVVYGIVAAVVYHALS